MIVPTSTAASNASASATVTTSLTVMFALPSASTATTLVLAVINAATHSALVPLTFNWFVIVTVPVVFPPTTLKSVAVTLLPALSLIAIATSVVLVVTVDKSVAPFATKFAKLSSNPVV